MNHIKEYNNCYVAFPAPMLYVPMMIPTFLKSDADGVPLDDTVQANYYSVDEYCNTVATYREPVPSVTLDSDGNPTHYMFGFELDYRKMQVLENFTTKSGLIFNIGAEYDNTQPLANNVVLMTITECREFMVVNPTFKADEVI